MSSAVADDRTATETPGCRRSAVRKRFGFPRSTPPAAALRAIQPRISLPAAASAHVVDVEVPSRALAMRSARSARQKFAKRTSGGRETAGNAYSLGASCAIISPSDAFLPPTGRFAHAQAIEPDHAGACLGHAGALGILCASKMPGVDRSILARLTIGPARKHCNPRAAGGASRPLGPQAKTAACAAVFSLGPMTYPRFDSSGVVVSSSASGYVPGCHRTVDAPVGHGDADSSPRGAGCGTDPRATL